MRKISHETRRHNAPRRLAAAAAALLGLAALAAGCGGDPDAGTGHAVAPADGACPVRVDATGWQAFRDLAGRITGGEAVGEDEFDALGEQPAFAAWRESLAPNVPPPLRVGNWVEEAFWTELGRSGDRKVNADRRALAASYRWAWEHRARIDSLAARLATGEAACAILARTAGWIDPVRLPRPLVVHVLPGKAELRYHRGAVFVDTGVLAAGAPDQLERQLASLLYRNLQAEDGVNPLSAAGDTAVVHLFRILRNEGVAAWIEDLPRTHFDPAHPRLRQVRLVPEQFYGTTRRTLELCAEQLPALLADPAMMAARGRTFASTVAAGGGLHQGGYGMAALIAARLGEARLQEAARTVAGFVAAYQEAARLNGAVPPAPGTPGVEPWETLPPLPPQVGAALVPLLETAFGPAS